MAHTLGSPSRRANQRYLHWTVRAGGPYSGQPMRPGTHGAGRRMAVRWPLRQYNDGPEVVVAAIHDGGSDTKLTGGWGAALCLMRARRQYGACRRANGSRQRRVADRGLQRSAERQTAAQAARQSGNVPQLASGTGRWQAAEERGEAALCTMQPARQYGACRLANGSTQRRAAGKAASRPGQAGRERRYAPAGRLQMNSL